MKEKRVREKYCSKEGGAVGLGQRCGENDASFGAMILNFVMTRTSCHGTSDFEPRLN